MDPFFERPDNSNIYLFVVWKNIPYPDFLLHVLGVICKPDNGTENKDHQEHFCRKLKASVFEVIKKKIACEREKNHEILLTDIFGPYHPNKVDNWYNPINQIQ